MRLEDGIYETPGGAKIGAKIGVIGGRAEFCGKGSEEVVKLKLGVLRPDIALGEAKKYKPEKGTVSGCPEFAKGLVKRVLAIPDEQAMKDVAPGISDAYAEEKTSFEASWLLTTPMSPFRHLQGGSWPGGPHSMDKRMSELLIRLPGFQRRREAHKENLQSDSDDAKAQKAWIQNPSVFPEWIWTEEDAEEAASIVGENPVFQDLK